MNGIFHTGAPPSANLNLVLQLAMAVALTVGTRFARHRRFRLHKAVQSLVILLNVVMIAAVMVPSFLRLGLLHKPAVFKHSYYAATLVHAFLGAITELLGLYVVLSAGTKLLPKRFRLQNFKLWMRTAFALWWIAIVSGIGVYYIWYAPRLH